MEYIKRKIIGIALSGILATASIGITTFAAPVNPWSEPAYTLSDLKDSRDGGGDYNPVEEWYDEYIPGFVGWFLDSDGHILYGTNTGLDLNGYDYYQNEWAWLDDDGDGIQECYYFDENGYLLMNGTAPDGYITNEWGQWADNGVVQTKTFDESIYNGTYRSVCQYIFASRSGDLTRIVSDDSSYSARGLKTTDYETAGSTHMELKFTYLGDGIMELNRGKLTKWIPLDDGTYEEILADNITLLGDTQAAMLYTRTGQASWQYNNKLVDMGGSVFSGAEIYHFVDEDTCYYLHYASGGHDEKSICHVLKRIE